MTLTVLAALDSIWRSWGPPILIAAALVALVRVVDEVRYRWAIRPHHQRLHAEVADYLTEHGDEHH